MYHHHHTTTVLHPFSGTTRVSRYQNRTSGLYGGREDLTEADTPTIRMDTTQTGLTSAHLHYHPIFLQAGCPSCCPTNSIKALKATTYIVNSTMYKQNCEA